MRITQTSSALPQDRESVYWLNTLAIPPSTKDKNTLQFAINTRIKLIYRPAALNDKKAVEAAYQQAKFARSGNKISVSNPTPYYLNLTKVTINNNELNEGFMVPPNSSLEIPNVPVGNSVTWQAINDYGGLSQKYTANF